MPELLDDIRSQITSRIQELRPVVQEAENLQRALDALAGTSTATQSNGRRATRPRSRTRAAKPRTRIDIRTAVIEHIRANPGSTAADVAKALNLKRTSIATRLTQLTKTGELIKADRGYSAP